MGPETTFAIKRASNKVETTRSTSTRLGDIHRNTTILDRLHICEKGRVDVGETPMRVEIGVVVLQHVDETVKHDVAQCQHKNEQRRLDKVRQDTKAYKETLCEKVVDKLMSTKRNRNTAMTLKLLIEKQGSRNRTRRSQCPAAAADPTTKLRIQTKPRTRIQPEQLSVPAGTARPAGSISLNMGNCEGY